MTNKTLNFNLEVQIQVPSRPQIITESNEHIDQSIPNSN